MVGLLFIEVMKKMMEVDMLGILMGTEINTCIVIGVGEDIKMDIFS